MTESTDVIAHTSVKKVTENVSGLRNKLLKCNRFIVKKQYAKDNLKLTEQTKLAR